MGQNVNATLALFDALSEALDASPCTNGEAGAAFMMLFEQIDRGDPHFMPIVLGAYGYDKRPSAEGRKPDWASAEEAAPLEGQPPAGGDAAREADT